jgi:hypothetical protein
MSDLIPTDDIKITESEWFKKSDRKTMLNLFLAGESVEQISEKIDGPLEGVARARAIRKIEDNLNHPYFLNRLNRKMQIKGNAITIKKLIIQNNLIDLYRDILNGEENPADLPIDKIIPEMTKLLKMDIPSGISIKQIINNTINNVNTAPHPAEQSKDDDEELFKKFGISIDEAETEDVNE